MKTPLHARFVLVAALTASLLGLALRSTPAAAEDDEDPPDLSGIYEVSGAFPNGDEYTGTVEIKKRKIVELRKGPRFTFCDVKFHYSTGWDGVGVGAVVDGRFYFALAHQGKNFSVVICRPVELSPELISLRTELDQKKGELSAAYAKGKQKDYKYVIKGDPWYQDVWRSRKYAMHFRMDGDWGTETLRPPNVDGHESTENPPLGAGEWWFDINHYSDKGKDETAVFGNYGKMMVEVPAEDGGIKITRAMYDIRNHKLLKPWNCAGMMPDAQTLVLVTAGDGSEGVGYYEFVGKEMKGKICDVNGVHPYLQTMAVPDEVISRNPALFH
ncbi:MAG: hypothetical protein AAB011_11895 [Candidatus Eisenbacteria bacterium]